MVMCRRRTTAPGRVNQSAARTRFSAASLGRLSTQRVPIVDQGPRHHHRVEPFGKGGFGIGQRARAAQIAQRHVDGSTDAAGMLEKVHLAEVHSRRAKLGQLHHQAGQPAALEDLLHLGHVEVAAEHEPARLDIAPTR